MAIYYISTTGDNGNDGSSDYPWAITALESTTKFAPGDTVKLKDGTYYYTGVDGGYLVTINKTGTAGNPITIMSENVGGAILDGGYEGGAGYVAYAPMMLYGTQPGESAGGHVVSYLNIDGIKFTRGKHAGINPSTDFQYMPKYINITRCEFYDIGRWNYTESGGMGALGIPGMGLNYILEGSSYWTIDRCLFHDIGRLGTANDFHDQIIMTGGNYITISNNIFYAQADGWAGACVSLEGEYHATACSNTTIVNNVFVGPQRSRPGHITIVPKVNNQFTNIIIDNNIFYQPTAYWNAAIWAYVWNSNHVGWGLGDVKIRNNITTAGTLIINTDDWNGQGVTSSGNILNTDPLFADAANHDYTLAPESPCIDTAYAETLPDHDYNNDSRPLPVTSNGDIGAYEVDAPGGGGNPSGNEITNFVPVPGGGTITEWTQHDANQAVAGLSSTNYPSRVAQTFVGDGNPLTSAVFRLQRVGSPTGNAYFKLYSVTAGSPWTPTSVLATSEALDVSTISDVADGTDYELTFPTPYTPANGTKYSLSVEYAGGDDSNRLRVRIDETDPKYPDEADWTWRADPWVVQGSSVYFKALSASYPNTYQASLTTMPGMILENGTSLTEKASIDLVDDNAGSWFYDADLDLIYMRPGGTADPDPDNNTYTYILPADIVVNIPCTDGSGSTPVDTANGLTTNLSNGTWGLWGPSDTDIIKFNGNNTNLKITAAAPVNGMPQFTYSGWFHPLEISSSPRLFSKESATATDAFYIAISANGYIGANIMDETTGYVSSGYSPSINHLNRWNYIVVTYDDFDDRKLHIYVNGVELTYSRNEAVQGTLVTSIDDIYIGDNYNNTRPFQGYLTKLKIRNYAMTAEDIATAYASEWALVDRLYKNTWQVH